MVDRKWRKLEVALKESWMLSDVIREGYLFQDGKVQNFALAASKNNKSFVI